jgi:dipeptidyl-peptidase-4
MQPTNHRLIVILTALLAVTSLTAPAQERKRDLTVDDIFASSEFQEQELHHPQWCETVGGRGRGISYLEADSATQRVNLYAFSISSGTRKVLIDASQLVPRPGEPPVTLASYQWFPDGQRILVTGAAPSLRGTTAGGTIGVYSTATKTFRLLADSSLGQSIVQLSPDGTLIGFVRRNNLYVMDAETGDTTQLTFDGSEDVINGAFDWVYEEEFLKPIGWQWSPDSRRVAFWRLDQSHVPMFPLVRYTKDNAHAGVAWMRYPKAGDPNSTVKIGVVDVRTRSLSWANLGPDTDIYIPRILWTRDPEVLSIRRLNRQQDTLDLLFFNVVDSSVSTVLRETDSAWIDIDDNLFFLQNSRQFLWTSCRDGFTHIYLYERDGTPLRQITKGEWDVKEIVGVDERRKLVYFTSGFASPSELHLYSIRIDGTSMRRLTKDAGVHSILFSPDYLVYLDTHSAFQIPPEVSLRSNEGAKVAQILFNSPGALFRYRIGDSRFFSFKTTDGVSLNGWMILPPDFDPARKYPVLMYVYGGPTEQTVVNKWRGARGLWFRMLAQRGYIVVSVDNRGTEGRGRAFHKTTIRRLGVRETADQVEAANYLMTLPYVDPLRIGIWGWSYGGYMTCMALTTGGGVFKAGMAIAPVTDWRYYDAIYTERYMKTPHENPDGYVASSPLMHAADLRGTLLIVHGTTDDNVHWQNTIVFVRELIRLNKQVCTMFYPGREHSISGENAERHLYTLMTEFLAHNL